MPLCAPVSAVHPGSAGKEGLGGLRGSGGHWRCLGWGSADLNLTMLLSARGVRNDEHVVGCVILRGL